MIKIEVDKKETSIELDGTRIELGSGIANIVVALLEEQKAFAKDIIFGLAQVCSKEEITDMLEKYYESEKMAKAFINGDKEKRTEILVDLLGKLFEEKKDE